MVDPDTVGVSAKGLHGSVHLWEKLWEVGNPEIAQILSGPKGSSDLWGELMVVVGGVPYKPLGVGDQHNQIHYYYKNLLFEQFSSKT